MEQSPYTLAEVEALQTAFCDCLVRIRRALFEMSSVRPMCFLMGRGRAANDLGAACHSAPNRLPLTARALRPNLGYDDEQDTFCLGTAPLDVGALNLHEIVKTTVPPCSTVIVAEVNARSSMLWVQFGFGQPGAPGMGVVGAVVVTENGVVPFLISDAGIATLPVTVIGAGFWPGA